MNDAVSSLLSQLNNVCLIKKSTVSTAESCTGGLVAANITEQSGVSTWFLGGVVSYSNHCKHHLLKVNKQDLKEHGAVSEQVARQMAIGANQVTGSDFSVSLTGVAGPTGGTNSKPVGTVWIAWASKNENHAHKFSFNGDRTSIREQAVEQALVGLLKIIKK